MWAKGVLETSLKLTYMDFIFWGVLEITATSFFCRQNQKSYRHGLQRHMQFGLRYLQKLCQEFEIGLISLEPLLVHKRDFARFSNVW